MNIGQLGKLYNDGDTIFRQGDTAAEVYVLQHGRVELIHHAEDDDDEAIVVTSLEPGDMFGQIALFRRSPRALTAIARGRSRVLTLSRDTFLTRIHEDPSLAYQGLKRLSERIDRLQRELLRIKRATDRDHL